MNNILAAVQDYTQRGFSLVPFRAIPPEPGKLKWSKKPIVSWEYRQRQAPDTETVLQEFRENPEALIGCCTGEVSGIVNLDIDDDEGREQADRLIPDSLLVPTYKTISGGQQMIFKAPKDCPPGAVRFLPGLDFRGKGSCTILPPSDKGYSWMDGLSLADVEPPQVPSALQSAIYNNINNSIYRGRNTSAISPDKLFSMGRRDNDLFHVANILTKGGMPENEIAQMLEYLIISWGEQPDAKWINEKIQSALKRKSRKSGDVTKAIEKWVSVTDGYFSVTDCRQALQTVTDRRQALQTVTDCDQTAFRVILHRLAKRGVIEKHGSKDGVYRRIDNEIEFMDFANADIANHTDLFLPLGLHIKTKIFPKGVIVVAGVSGTGKTLFCFNTIAENMGRFPIFYFNSEMGPEALKEKLSHFPISINEWNQHMKVVDNWDFNNIADKIQPDAFNVVDYLEPEGEKAFNIHGVISAIIKRLNKGTALITIQKKPAATMGTGGIYSIKAATLAIALDWGKIEIVKNRFREADMTPSLNKINFEVHQGHKFVKQGGWYK